MDVSPQDDDGRLTLGGDTWSRGLTLVTEAQIADGLSACIIRNDVWPPTLPEFRGMCLGIPSIAAVRRAITARSRTPFVRLVWQNLDSYRFSRADQQTADRMLRDAYEIARDHVMRGGELPAPAAGEIEHKEPERKKPVSAEAVAAFAAKMGVA
jgi:hypothetical protein